VARELCQDVYRLSGEVSFSKDFGLRDQVRRAAISIMANIAEGFDASTNPEFVQFPYYALRSASEVQSHLYIAKDQGYLSETDFVHVYEQAGRVKSMIYSFADYLRSNSRTVSRQTIKRTRSQFPNLEPRTSNLERP
jgi:four helix bundle protein